MNIDLGFLGKVELTELDTPLDTEIGLVIADGHTDQGVRVHMVLNSYFVGHIIWHNAICLEYS